MNTNMSNRCRVLRSLALAALLTFAAFANIASPTMAAPTNPPTPTCLANCNNILPVLGVVVCPVVCNNTNFNDCDNDCKAFGTVSIANCNQICLNLGL